jgi:hypothetical protein
MDLNPPKRFQCIWIEMKKNKPDIPDALQKKKQMKICLTPIPDSKTT